jgi:tRNA pseudouridine13 synthase
MTELSGLPAWAHVLTPSVSGSTKSCPQDFQVEEVLGYDLGGTGEHLYLYIEKRGLTTQEMISALSKKLRIHSRLIAYSGLKDKHAITRQWISVHTPQDLDATLLSSIPDIKLLKYARHSTKLRRGAHQANRFEITLRDLPAGRVALAELARSMERISLQGVPNYFGEQRFGRGGKNIDKARALFAGKMCVPRLQRGLYLSAARSLIFNDILSKRVIADNWSTGLPGEVMMLDGSNSFFKTDALNREINARLQSFDIHPSAPLWGSGELGSSMDAHAMESKLSTSLNELCHGLEDAGLRMQRRATRLMVRDLNYEWLDSRSLILKFWLQKGAYATTVLRELITIKASA